MEESKNPKQGQRGGRGGRGSGGQGRGGGHGGRGQQNLDRHPRRSNRGGHGQGGKPFDQPFDKREYQNQRRGGDQNQHRGGNRGRGGLRRGQRQGQARTNPINAPKDSFYYKYFYGPYPEIKEIEVTLDTEIPTIPEAEKLPVPSEEEYAKQMKECDDKIQELRSKITAINDEKRAVTTTRKQEKQEQQEPGAEVEGKNFKELLSEKQKLVNKRKELNEIVEKQNESMSVINEDIRKLNKYIDKGCKTKEDVDKKIKELNKTLTTESVSVVKEKEMFKQVQFLEKSKPYYETYELLQKKLDASKAKLFEAKGEVGTLSKKIKSYNKTLDEMNEEFKSKKELKDKYGHELDKLEAKIQDIKKEIGELYEKKTQIREEHYKQKFNYESQLEEINYHQYLKGQKDHLLAQEKERLKKEAEEKRKEEEKLEKKRNMPNPFEDEINLCAYLITQLKLKKRDHESSLSKFEAEAKRREEDAERKKEMVKRQEEGKIQIYQKEDDHVVIGKKQRKKQKQKQQKGEPAQPTQVEEKITTKDSSKNKIDLKYDVVKGLVELGIDVPEHKVDDIDKAVDQLNELKEKYEERGRKKLEEIFKSDKWEEEYQRQVENPEDEFFVNEEEEKVEEKKPKERKQRQKYVKEEDTNIPLE